MAMGMDFAGTRDFGPDSEAAAPWFGLERLGGTLDACGQAALIGIDLAKFPPHFSARFREETFEWQRWIERTTGRGDLWFADRIGALVWFYAEMPAPFRREEQHVYLHGMAKRLQQLIVTDAGGAAGDGNERGFGFALLDGWRTRPPREVVYDAVAEVSAQLNASLQDRLDRELHAELDRLLKESSLKAVYQPITQLSDGKVFGFEALTRCPEGSLFDGPLALFKFAEQDNRAFALDRMAREKAIRHCPPLGKRQKIFINVTMGIINDPHFVSGQTINWLADKGLDPGQVVFELTERSSIDDFDAAKKILDHYRRQGYEIAIDDAGAGYSSLQSIVELSPDYIKVDRSLVKMADQDEMKKHMLRTFVRFARKMNIRTVAEGIERPEELRLLRTMGFDYGQGYLLGRPAEPHRASALINPTGLPRG